MSEDRTQCQAVDLPAQAAHVGRLEVLLQRIVKLALSVRKRLRFAGKTLRRLLAARRGAAAAPSRTEPLMAGDRVRVLSRNEIEATLDERNRLRGCTFMDEMWNYCGTEQTVLKRIERYLDEGSYIVRKLGRLVILKDVHCSGADYYGRCDRTCFFFWREEWLQRIRNQHKEEEALH